MAWDPLNSTEILPGKVGKTRLFDKIKNCLEYLYGLIGGDSGIIGLKNGSFENDSGAPDYHPTNWTIGLEANGGEITVLSTNFAARGAKVLKLNLPGSGGTSAALLRSDKFMVQAGRPIMFRLKALPTVVDLLRLRIGFWKADQNASVETPVSLLPYDWPIVTYSGEGYIFFEPTSAPIVPVAGAMSEIQAVCTVPSDACWCTIELEAQGTSGYWLIDDVEALQDESIMPWVLVGDNLLQSANTERYTASKDYVKIKSIKIYRSGKYRVKFDLKGGVPTDDAYGQIFRNDVAYGTERYDTDGSYTTYSEDLYFARGDTIDLYCKAATYTTYAYVRNLQIFHASYHDFHHPPRVLQD